jgi:hypothetical protein
MATAKKPKEETFERDESQPAIQIKIPEKVDLSGFASDLEDEDEAASLAQLNEPLNIRKFQEIRDYVWVHSDPAYTSPKPYFIVKCRRTRRRANRLRT